MLRRLDGKCDIGFCDGGTFVDLGRIYDSEGGIYDGMMRGGVRHGRGVYFNEEEKTWLVGNFSEGKCRRILKSGHGTYPFDQV